MERDDIVDAIADLKHDLGKYLRLPIAMLPADADSTALRLALDTALNRTRSGPRGVLSAREIWDAFADEAEGALGTRPRYLALEEAVRRALAWERVLADTGRSPDRAELEADFGAVAARIGDLLEEVAHGRK